MDNFALKSVVVPTSTTDQLIEGGRPVIILGIVPRFFSGTGNIITLEESNGSTTIMILRGNSVQALNPMIKIPFLCQNGLAVTTVNSSLTIFYTD